MQQLFLGAYHMNRILQLTILTFLVPYTQTHCSLRLKSKTLGKQVIARSFTNIAKIASAKQAALMGTLTHKTKIFRAEVLYILSEHTRQRQLDTKLILACNNPFNTDAFEIQDLLEEGADPNAYLPSKLTPLHFAAYRKHVPAIEALIEHGAYVNATTVFNETPLHLACSLPLAPAWKSFHAIEALIQAGAHKYIPSQRVIQSNGVIVAGSPLRYALLNGDLDTCFAVLRTVSKHNIRFKHDETKICHELRALHKHLRNKNQKGQTLHEEAKARNEHDIAQLFDPNNIWQHAPAMQQYLNSTNNKQ